MPKFLPNSCKLGRRKQKPLKPLKKYVADRKRICCSVLICSSTNCGHKALHSLRETICSRLTGMYDNSNMVQSWVNGHDPLKKEKGVYYSDIDCRRRMYCGAVEGNVHCIVAEESKKGGKHV